MAQGTRLSRRDFFTVSSACGIAAMGSGCTSLIGKNAEELNTFRASCTMECLHCHLKATVENGKIVRIESANPHDGKACARGLSRAKWIYAKDRILTPLKRVGERGEGKFEPITWEEALDTVAAKMQKAIDIEGPQSILMTSASGNMDALTNSVMKALGAHLGGVTHQVGSLCCSAVTAAMVPMVGQRYCDTRDTINQSKYIIAWGNNPMVTMQAYWPRYLEAMEKGAKLIVIDPRRSETAVRADKWIPIVPGTDTALMLGMIRYIIKHKLYDEKFLTEHTGAVYLVDHDDKLIREDASDPNSYLVWDSVAKKMVRHDAKGVRPALSAASADLPYGTRTVFDMIGLEVEPWNPTAVEIETKVPAALVEELAKDYATSGASMIIQNMGSFQRIEYGTYAAAGQFYLALLTGNIGRPGAGICDAGGVNQMVKFGSAIPAPKKKPAKVRGIPTAKLGEYILKRRPHAINVWYSQTCAPIGQWPNANKVIEAAKAVPFFVVADSVMTPTCMYADIVLPVTTVFEYESLLAGDRTHYVQWSEKAVEPQGEAKPDRWIIAQLAKRLGCGEAFDLTVDQMAENVLKPAGISLSDVKKNPVCPVKGDWIPFRDGKFKTPNGKANLFCESWAAKNFYPIVRYNRAKESPKGGADSLIAAKYPLQAIQRKVIRNIHTSHQNNEWINEVFTDGPTVIINTEDAKRRRIADGETVMVYNARGKHTCKAVVTDNIIKGTVCLENGWWMDKNGFNSSSVLTNDTIEVLGSATAICSTLVNVRKIRKSRR